ncbi:hypothetical protein FOZ62_002796, partial [Perkinsus olseni]
KAATYFGCGYYATELLTMAEFTALPSNILDLDDVAETVHSLKYGTSYYILRDFCILFGMGLIWRLLTLAWLEIIVKYRRDGLDSMLPLVAHLIDYFNTKFNPVVTDPDSHRPSAPPKPSQHRETNTSETGGETTSETSGSSSFSRSISAGGVRTRRATSSQISSAV